MILKKPYSFIIKHFRLINIIMLISSIFIFINLRDLYNLFRNLQETNTFIYALATTYINNLIYFFMLIGISACFIVLFLFYKKKKPILTYFVYFIYIIINFVYFFIVFNNLNSLAENVFELETILLLKDISLLNMIACIPFMFILGIRGIGFNLKQFNFSKDAEELAITEEDSQEFELVLGQNNYKYLRTIRRLFRELKYYIIENKFTITLLIIVSVLILSGFSIFYYNKYQAKLNEKSLSVVNGLVYKINSSYVTERDYNGNIVKEDYKYVIVNVTVFNNNYYNTYLNLEKISLENNGLIYYPTLTKNESFYDLGLPYTYKSIIESGSSSTFTLCFELPAISKVTSPVFRVMYGIEDGSKNFLSLYRLFKLNINNIDEEIKTNTYNINDVVSVKEIDQNNYDFIIKDYSIQDIYSYKYLKCDKNVNCSSLTDIIKSDNQSNNTILELDYNDIMYSDSLFSDYFNNTYLLLNSYLTIRYNSSGKIINRNIKVVKENDIDNKIFLEVDRDIIGKKDVYLIYNFRNTKYEIKLF